MSRSGVRAWLELLRVSNTPTVVSNALTGCALGAAGRVTDHIGLGTSGAVGLSLEFPWKTFGLVAPALVLIYVAGMATNDAMDIETDRLERPNRPIPSGRVSRRASLVVAVLLSIAALGLLDVAGVRTLVFGLALVICATAYNAVHSRHPASVVLMGGCRALAILTGVCAVGWPPVWEWVIPVAAFMWVYVIAISWVARGEARGLSSDRTRVRVVVSMVCAISLVDAVVLGLLGFWIQAGLAVGCFMLAAVSQRKILGT